MLKLDCIDRSIDRSILNREVLLKLMNRGFVFRLHSIFLEMQQDRAQQLKHEGRTMENSRGHYIAASRILSEIQQRRERLESNLGTIVRQREEERLYEYLDQHER